MPDKLAQLRTLILEGYSVVGIDSNEDYVLTTLRRGAQTVTVRLHRSDAEKLLFSDPLRVAR